MGSWANRGHWDTDPKPARPSSSATGSAELEPDPELDRLLQESRELAGRSPEELRRESLGRPGPKSKQWRRL